MAAVLLVTMVLPVLALSAVIAGCAFVGATISLNGQDLP